MPDPFKTKSLALHKSLKRAGPLPMRMDLECFRRWLREQLRWTPTVPVEKRAWACCYCREWMTLQEISVDHKEPISQGGINYPSNWALCCKRCNETKGAASAETFTAMLDLLDKASVQDKQSVLTRLRAGWRMARSRNYKRRAGAR